MLSLLKGDDMPFVSKLLEDDKQNIFKWAAEGMPFTEIVKRIDNRVSKQRIHQLCKREGINPTDIRKVKNEKERNDRMTAKWGTKWNDKEWRKSEICYAMKEKFKNKKTSAQYSKWGFSLNFEDLEWPEVCPVLGIELDYFALKASENSVSFDRIDPTKGYEKGNVAVMSWRANRIKNDGTAEEHRKIASFIDLYT